MVIDTVDTKIVYERAAMKAYQVKPSGCKPIDRRRYFWVDEVETDLREPDAFSEKQN